AFMLNGTGLSMANYDATLIGWAALATVPSGIELGADGLRYCAATADRQSLIDDHGWTINGDAEDCAVLTPAAPAGLTAEPGDAQVALYWDANSEEGITAYTIYGGTATNPTDVVGTVD